MAEAAVAVPSVCFTCWTVDQLKDYLRDHHLPVTGVKSVLVERVKACDDILFFEDELDAKTFQQFHSKSIVVPSFDSLPEGPRCKENFLLLKSKMLWITSRVKEVTQKNYRTGVHLCQCVT